jgi:CRP-like cAMP-binding protein
VVGRIEEGDIFGMSPLLGTGRHLATAVCSEPATVLSIEAAPLRELLQSEPATGFHIMSVAAQAYFERYIENLKRVQRVIGDIVAV